MREWHVDDDRYECYAAAAIWLAFLSVIALASALAFSCLPGDAAGAPAPLPRRVAAPPQLEPREVYGWWMDRNVPTWLGPDGRVVALWWRDSWWCGGWRVEGRSILTWGGYWTPAEGLSAETSRWGPLTPGGPDPG